MIVYVETSAAVKLLVEEAESATLAAYLDEVGNPVSSMLTETELRRMAVRDGVDQIAVTEMLAAFVLVELDRAGYVQAGQYPDRHLRSLDALHIAAAQAVDATVFVSYDKRQSEAARAQGLVVVSPG